MTEFREIPKNGEPLDKGDATAHKLLSDASVGGSKQVTAEAASIQWVNKYKNSGPHDAVMVDVSQTTHEVVRGLASVTSPKDPRWKAAVEHSAKLDQLIADYTKQKDLKVAAIGDKYPKTGLGRN